METLTAARPRLKGLAIVMAAVFMTSCALWSGPPASDVPAPASIGSASMCGRQGETSAGELKEAVEIMRVIVAEKGRLTAAEEEALITGKGFTPDRFNCLMGKLIAANDVFDWGPAASYGLSVSEKEYHLARQYEKDAKRLKNYMEQTLNIKADRP